MQPLINQQEEEPYLLPQNPRDTRINGQMCIYQPIWPQQKEKKPREDLKTRQDAGKINIFIRGSQIITKVSRVTWPTHATNVTSNQVEDSNTDARQDTKGVTGATQILRTPTSQQ